jgi:hypothetical protein
MQAMGRHCLQSPTQAEAATFRGKIGNASVPAVVEADTRPTSAGSAGLSCPGPPYNPSAQWWNWPRLVGSHGSRTSRHHFPTQYSRAHWTDVTCPPGLPVSRVCGAGACDPFLGVRSVGVGRMRRVIRGGASLELPIAPYTRGSCPRRPPRNSSRSPARRWPR